MKINCAFLSIIFISTSIYGSVFAGEVTNLSIRPSAGSATLSWELPADVKADGFAVFLRYIMPTANQASFRLTNLTSDSRLLTFDVDPLSEISVRVEVMDGTNSSRGVTVKTNIPHPRVIPDEYEKRRLYIYLPEGYERSKTVYPVVYMFDGQNLFSRRTGSPEEWRIDENLDRLIKEGTVPPMVVVGISHGGSKRGEEYIPYDGAMYFRAGSNFIGKGRSHFAWIVSNLMPYVESRYKVSRKREDRAIMGSSLGGLAAIYNGLHYHRVFSFAGAFSPFGPWNLQDVGSTSFNSVRFYIDYGTTESVIKEFNYTQHTRALIQAFQKNGWSYGTNLWLYECPNAIHSEKDWSMRVENAFILFKGIKPGRLTNVTLADVRVLQPYGGTNRIANPIAWFDNGLRFSLMNTAQYSAATTSNFISPWGEMVFPKGSSALEISAIYQDFTVKRVFK